MPLKLDEPEKQMSIDPPRVRLIICWSVPNELDVAVLAENRLYLVECKTRQWRGGVDGPGAESLFKLEALTDLLGGLQARGMLVSYQDLPDHDRRRAADLRIEVCAGQQIQRLGESLKKWIHPA